MPLFQPSVLKKYCRDLEQEIVRKAWTAFRDHFQDAGIQENIRNLKEEAYQEGFIRDLFVRVLGYTLNPQPGYDLVLEQKSVTDSTKSDAAILGNGEVIAVIELKDTGTPDLERVSTQAFGYKHKHKDCRYVITSNFEKLRFYIDDATEHEEFNLFTLTEEQFTVFYLCLHQKSLLADLPKEIKGKSLISEENVTKRLYDDYSDFKRKLFDSIVTLNPLYDPLLLFKKTQKLLDRFLFILFAEDRLLLPPNSISDILQQWQELKTRYDEYFPLYDRFKKYFGYMNEGHKGQHYEIFAYNGGLFSPDEVLDSIKVDDDVLYAGTKALTGYDFETEVDVNILGHIFEHSLTEIEELQAQLEGKAVEKKKTKRKKEGVFYTPRYITRYIVENTVGALCDEKKQALKIDEESFAPGKRKDNRKKLLEKLDAYRAWLLELKICDPACGSGAFLNAALEFLIAEHRMIDELKARVFGASMVYSDIENSILENNLYGVDLNEDAVEIAKLSLWLRTAQKGRKLSNLSTHIRCGNSLVDDPAVAGEKTFRWEEEFAQVFARGGFDVVIGNPPYVKVQNLHHKEIDWFKSNKKVAHKRVDISIMFFELAKSLLKQGGLLSFITSNQFLVAEYGRKARQFIIENLGILKIIDFGDLPIFEDALTYVSIFTLANGKNEKFQYQRITSIEDARNGTYSNPTLLDQQDLNEESWILTGNSNLKLIAKIQSHKALHSYAKCYYGIVSGNDDIFIIDRDKIVEHSFEGGCLLPLVRAQNCYRYDLSDFDLFILYPYQFVDGKTELIPEKELCLKYPNAYKYLLKNKSALENRKDSRTTFQNSSNWYSLTRFGQMEVFNSEKIIFPGEQKTSKFGIDNNKAGYSGARVFSIVIDDKNIDLKFLLTIFNSKLINFYVRSTFPLKQGGYYSMSSTFVNDIPIAVSADQNSFVEKADFMLSKNKKLRLMKDSFIHLLKSKQEQLIITKKLANWPILSPKNFLEELQKQKIKLSLAEQQEWLSYFEEQKARASELQRQIDETDREIDRMVYALYGLSEEEIRIIERS